MEILNRKSSGIPAPSRCERCCSSGMAQGTTLLCLAGQAQRQPPVLCVQESPAYGTRVPSPPPPHSTLRPLQHPQIPQPRLCGRHLRGMAPRSSRCMRFLPDRTPFQTVHCSYKADYAADQQSAFKRGDCGLQWQEQGHISCNGSTVCAPLCR